MARVDENVEVPVILNFGWRFWVFQLIELVCDRFDCCEMVRFLGFHDSLQLIAISLLRLTLVPELVPELVADNSSMCIVFWGWRFRNETLREFCVFSPLLSCF